MKELNEFDTALAEGLASGGSPDPAELSRCMVLTVLTMPNMMEPSERGPLPPSTDRPDPIPDPADARLDATTDAPTAVLVTAVTVACTAWLLTVGGARAMRVSSVACA